MISRFFIGNLFYLAKKSVFEDDLKSESGFFVKYTITFSIGMIVGTFFIYSLMIYFLTAK